MLASGLKRSDAQDCTVLRLDPQTGPTVLRKEQTELQQDKVISQRSWNKCMMMVMRCIFISNYFHKKSYSAIWQLRLTENLRFEVRKKRFCRNLSTKLVSFYHICNKFLKE